MAIDDNTSYELTGYQVKDLAQKIRGKADDDVFVGAGTSVAGSRGLVPAPVAGDNTKFLKGDGTWQSVANNYSTTEQALNQTWTDGSQIYRKVGTITISNLPTGDSSWAHGIADIKEIVSFKILFKLGWAADEWGTETWMSSHELGFRINKTNVIAEAESAIPWSGTFKYVVEYTKTTD